MYRILTTLIVMFSVFIGGQLHASGQMSQHGDERHSHVDTMVVDAASCDQHCTDTEAMHSCCVGNLGHCTSSIGFEPRSFSIVLAAETLRGCPSKTPPIVGRSLSADPPPPKS